MPKRALGSSMSPQVPIPTALQLTNSRIKSLCPRRRVRSAVRRAPTAASPCTADSSGRYVAPLAALRVYNDYRESFRSAGIMPSSAMNRARRLTCWRALGSWVCAFSLLIVLANRVPHFPESASTCAPSAPPHLTAKLLAKDFYLLQPPASGIISHLHSTTTRKAAKEAGPLFPVSLDNRLYTRPPPTS